MRRPCSSIATARLPTKWFTYHGTQHRKRAVPSETAMTMRLSPRATLYFLLQRSLVWIVLGLWLAAMFGGLFTSGSVIPGAAVLPAVLCVGALFALSALFCRVRARSYAIELGSEGIAIEHGVLRRVHETLMYGRIQDIL